jgi:hypothetical protein
LCVPVTLRRCVLQYYFREPGNCFPLGTGLILLAGPIRFRMSLEPFVVAQVMGGLRMNYENNVKQIVG